MAGKQLTEHFHSREFNCRDGTPVDRRDYNGLTHLCNVYLEPLRKKYGPVHINSGFRTASYNAKIGGATRSYHIYTIHDGNDQAADVSCAQGTSGEWHRTLAWIRENRRNGKGGLGLYRTFVHVDLREYRADWRG